MRRWFAWLPFALVIVATLGVAVAIGLYVFTFQSSGISDNPQRWSDFGGYVGGTVGPLVSVMSLAVVLYIAVTVTEFQKTQERLLEEQAHKTGVAFDMHREFHTESMLIVRTEAGKLAYEGSYKTLDKLDQTTNPVAPKLWTVIHFFERLSLAVKHEQINTNLVPDLFGDTFIWWYEHCFKNQLQPTGWESWQRIDYLMRWLRENTKNPEDLRSREERAKSYGPKTVVAG